MNILFKLNLQLFAEEEKNDLSLADAYNKLKEESVSKEEYEKLRAEHNEVIAKIMNGEAVQTEIDDEESIDDIRKKIFSGKLTNLEYAQLMLRLRKKQMDNGEPDPLLAYGRKIFPDADDIEAAELAAQGLQHCIDASGGNPRIFNRELELIQVDAIPFRKK